MFIPVLEHLLAQYTASPAVFWGAITITTLLLGAGLMMLGLCHLSAEADDRADQILAQLQRRQAQ
jgi:hypothetical protein